MRSFAPTPQTPLLWLASLKLTGEISDPNRSAFPRGTAQISKLAHSQELQRIDMILFRDPIFMILLSDIFTAAASGCKKLGL